MTRVDAPEAGGAAPEALHLEFDDNSLLSALYGEYDEHLARIEQELGVSLASRGNQVAITGSAGDTEIARDALRSLYDRLKRGLAVGPADVDAAMRMAQAGLAATGDGDTEAGDVHIHTRKRRIEPRSPTQAVYIRAMQEHELVFGLGPSGTGKTYLAVATAVSMLLSGQVDRLILSRPAVEAGERLGFLPGDLREKVDPYLRPLYDALYDTMLGEQVVRRLSNGEIEVAPLAFMRGRTLTNAFIILDEAQNTTPIQMKMFLTRLGENSRMVVTGDISQTDLPGGARSGLQDASDTLSDVKGVSFVRFSHRDVVRHNLVTRIVRAYEQQERGRTEKD